MTNAQKQRLVLIAVAIAMFGVMQYMAQQKRKPTSVSYSDFVHKIENGKVAEVEIQANEFHAYSVTKEQYDKNLKDKAAKHWVASRLPEMEDQQLVSLLKEHKVRFSGKIEMTPWWEPLLLGWILPLGVMILIYMWFMRRLGRREGPLSIGKSKVKIYDQSQENRVTFDDVAGVDEAKAELIEVVKFLKEPAKYQVLGAKIPKGVLLVGSPGTGKTLLAKAVAGEAAVPFFSISGSEFVEMFVGVGAARMRNLFEQAKERAPCIVFVDELDAIGKSRGGVAAMATHDEREQTLNQLLVEMDGFDPGRGVVIMAATNRPEVLDAALIRPGRFDRQVVVDRPDVAGRLAILRVHAKKIKLAEGIDLEVIARRTPGMVGADLANIVNEAALAAARREGTQVQAEDFEEAIDRIQLGLKKQGRAMNEEEKRRVAFHEAGHTLVALSVEHADPVHRVTIVPRSIGALGATLQLPTEDRYLMTREELLDRLCVMLGGRAAEKTVCGNVSTGAQNDLERATETARQMVCRFGMSEKLGPVTFGRPMGARFLDAPVQLGEERNFSEQTALAIDEEVSNLVMSQNRRALDILRARRQVLESIASRLLEKETLERQELEELVTVDSKNVAKP